MKNSMPIVTAHRARNSYYKSYLRAVCHSIRPLSIGGNDFCIFRIEKTNAGRWCCISRGEIRRERYLGLSLFIFKQNENGVLGEVC